MKLSSKYKWVALLAEGVDRNSVNQGTNLMADASPSSRRAWIEIPFQVFKKPRPVWSPSSRRAWIEIWLPT